jgi:hypothetical protein
MAASRNSVSASSFFEAHRFGCPSQQRLPGALAVPLDLLGTIRSILRRLGERGVGANKIAKQQLGAAEVIPPRPALGIRLDRLEGLVPSLLDDSDPLLVIRAGSTLGALDRGLEIHPGTAGPEVTLQRTEGALIAAAGEDPHDALVALDLRRQRKSQQGHRRHTNESERPHRSSSSQSADSRRNRHW